MYVPGHLENEPRENPSSWIRRESSGRRCGKDVYKVKVALEQMQIGVINAGEES